MNKTLGLLLLGLGAIFVLKVFAAGWFLFLIIAAGLAIGASTGAIAKWGYAAAALFGLLAFGAGLFRTVFAALTLSFAAIGMLIKLLPYILLAYGAYVLLKAFSK